MPGIFPLVWGLILTLLGLSQILEGIKGIKRREVVIQRTRSRGFFALRPRWITGKPARFYSISSIVTGTLFVICGITLFMIERLPLDVRPAFAGIILFLMAYSFVSMLVIYDQWGSIEPPQ